MPKAKEMLLPEYCIGYEVVKAVARPRELVAVSVYPPVELPTRSCPYVGAVEMPVPPTFTASVEEETSAVPLKKTGAPVVKVVALVPPLLMASVPVVSLRAIPSEEVAKAVTFPVAPVKFPRMVLGAICASLVRAMPLVVRERVPLVPPTREPKVPEKLNSPARVSVVVATDWRAPVPEPYTKEPEVKVVFPVPPPLTVRVPESVGVKVKAAPVFVILSPMV